MYDRFVERRQRKVLHTVVQSRENVLLLEQMVRERTSKLETSNEQLEEANRRVVQASELQLKHFACMSHEIRCVPDRCCGWYPFCGLCHTDHFLFRFRFARMKNALKLHHWACESYGRVGRLESVTARFDANDCVEWRPVASSG